MILPSDTSMSDISMSLFRFVVFVDATPCGRSVFYGFANDDTATLMVGTPPAFLCDATSIPGQRRRDPGFSAGLIFQRKGPLHQGRIIICRKVFGTKHLFNALGLSGQLVAQGKAMS